MQAGYEKKEKKKIKKRNKSIINVFVVVGEGGMRKWF